MGSALFFVFLIMFFFLIGWGRSSCLLFLFVFFLLFFVFFSFFLVLIGVTLSFSCLPFFFHVLFCVFLFRITFGFAFSLSGVYICNFCLLWCFRCLPSVLVLVSRAVIRWYICPVC